MSCPCTLPAAILAVGGWSGLQGVCRAPEDQTKSCRRQRDIFMRIRPFSQLRCIQTGRLLSVGEQRERAPSRVGTGGCPCKRPSHVGQYQRQSACFKRGGKKRPDSNFKKRRFTGAFREHTRTAPSFCAVFCYDVRYGAALAVLVFIGA